MAEDVHLPKIQGFPDLSQLPHETIYAPEGSVRGRFGVARTELIVKDDGALIAQRSQRLEVIGRSSRTTVKHQERRRSTTPNYAIPYLSARCVDVTLARREPTIGLACQEKYGEAGSCCGNSGHPSVHEYLTGLSLT
jgi:hypothetical protein